MNIVGLCGYAKVGKDTAAENMEGWVRYAFADKLKADLKPLLNMLGVDLNNPEHKQKVRGLLVEWGRTARSFRSDFWITRLFSQIWGECNEEDQIVITDVRYLNEVEAVMGRGGVVIRIDRPGFKAANEEEAISIALIDKSFPLIHVVNDGTPKELGEKIMKIVGGAV